ncbi:MAG: NIPSNAP family protein [Spirochaetaceae bacterium]|jgi:hypothetical protein|nr:NIPSNAP family protein [Spirochaetaceae bacterium]
MIYELRIYDIHPGRMDNIKKRFEEKTLALFEKQQMIVLDFWQDLNADKIYYVVQHDDVESRNRNFDAFLNDPEWLETKRLSELDGPIVQKVESFLMSRIPFGAGDNYAGNE